MVKGTDDENSIRQGVKIPVTTTVQKWGNSLAVRIPSIIAEQAAIEQGSEVEIQVNERCITLIPKQRKSTLDELLAMITPENRHSEIDFGVEGNERI